ncbi:hypothetical protein OH807_02740 [Kitasatospora sp. NBC_01560]|uniref:hypothetical protein n=1 Tax=Kitasatospora sp. NBC_01560 TaxID=2975965 RepID=UPI003865DBBE
MSERAPVLPSAPAPDAVATATASPGTTGGRAPDAAREPRRGLPGAGIADNESRRSVP